MNRVLPFFSSGGFAYAPTLSGMVADYNLNTAAIAAGWDGIRPLIATVTIAAGAIVYGASTAAGAAAFTVPVLPEGSLVTIVRNGSIIGRGGTGGAGGGATIGSAAATVGGTGYDALKLSWPVRLVGTGMIAGGGGGGGGGQGITIDSPNGQYNSAGGSGGMGASNGGSTVGNTGGSGVRNGDGTYHATGGKAGDGGLPGQQGGAGGLANTSVGPVNSTRAPAAGGQPGRSIVGAEFVILDGATLGDVRGAMAFGINSYIATPQATPAAGAALDGGYYAGYRLWGMVEADESGVSRTLTIGAVAFYFPGMVGNPKLYGGQTVWLRSASNPAIQLSGTVQGAANGLLSINITNGSGTASDWVLMAAFRIVVPPKGLGETTIAIADASLALPLETYTLTEGRISQAAMLAASPTLAAAAAFAASLTIGGKTDWVVPTRDMQEGAYRGLKPVTVNNYAAADRATGAAQTYQRYGARADSSDRHGLKQQDPDVPIPANSYYTSSTPSRTAQAAFQQGGAEAFDYGAGVLYLTSTAYDANSVWAQMYDPTNGPGRQIVVPKNTVARVRAMRLSII